jgi:hypothetical protein
MKILGFFFFFFFFSTCLTVYQNFGQTLVSSPMFHRKLCGFCFCFLFLLFSSLGKHWFSNSEADWGFREFILLKDLHGASRRLLFNDTLIVEAEIKVMSTVKRFP